MDGAADAKLGLTNQREALCRRADDNVWLERLLRRIEHHQGPVIIEGGEAFGAPFLIDALSKTRKVAWLDVTPADARDGVALGNALAEAVNFALRATLLPHALPFAFGVELLKSQLSQVGPLMLACSNADRNPLFYDALLSLHGGLARVVLDVAGVGGLPEAALYLSRAELKLTSTEARVLAGVLAEDELATLYRVSGGAYTAFLTGLLRIKGEPDPLLPAPGGVLVPADRERLVTPEALLDTLTALGRHVEALDLAVMKVPKRVPEVLKDAGPVYQDSGLIGRLYLLLQSLAPEDQENEEVLAWLLLSSVSRGAHRELLPRVRRFLGQHEAPHLRARYAATLHDTGAQFAEARRAAASEPSPLNLFQLGRLHPDAGEAVGILTESVRLAEAYGRPYDIARNAGALSQRLLDTGAFEQAAIWAEWALRVFDQHGLKDGDRRLRLLNQWAYSRLLIGEAVGLDTVLRDAERALGSAELGLATLFRSTLAELELSRGNLEEAERLASDNLMRSQRRLLGTHAVTAVRVLLEKGDTRQALAEGRRAVELTASEGDDYALPALLALGMAESSAQPERSRERLVRVMNAPHLKFDHRAAAMLHLLNPESGNAKMVPAAGLEQLKKIPHAGIRLLSGPERVFHGVWQELSGTELPLRISVLGSARVSLAGVALALPPRQLEVLTLLALHPEGLTLEALHTALYERADTSLEGLKVAVTKLRKLVSVGTQPYRLTVPYYLDAHACERHLDEGKLRAALGLYGGPLLGGSQAPGIVEARGWLEERLRQAALMSGDAEALFALGEALRSDPELLEAALMAFAKGDPRVPLVRARLETFLN